MSAELATLALAVVAGTGFASLTSLAIALVWPWLRRRLAHARAEQRARSLWRLAVAPAALPFLLVALCFLPGLLGAAQLASDHCDRHPEHPHLCLIHANAGLTSAGAVVLACATAFLLAAIVPEAVRLARARRWLARLPRRNERWAPDVEIVETRLPLSFTEGLWRPRIHVAATLVAALPEPQLEAVIAHERAHVRRRDPLARITARVLSLAHLPPLRRTLLGELTLASEQACDAEAGRAVGDRLVVAEAILAVERMLAAATPVHPGLARFEGCAAAARVEALLAGEAAAAPRETVWTVWLAGIAALALADPLHHATEHLLALLARLF